MAGARDFLKVYDATISFAKLSDSDKTHTGNQDNEQEDEVQDGDPPPPLPSPPTQEKAKPMAGERELTTGLLSKDASFRLIVTGQVGVREIERLIQKLQLDKEILADFVRTGDTCRGSTAHDADGASGAARPGRDPATLEKI